MSRAAASTLFALLLISCINLSVQTPVRWNAVSSSEDESSNMPKEAINFDGPNMGLNLYSEDSVKPTCMAHGGIHEYTANPGPRQTKPYVSYHNWIQRAVDRHNKYRLALGYKPVTLSHNLTEISQAIAFALDNSLAVRRDMVIVINATNGEREPEAPLPPPKRYEDTDILYEESFFNENIRFQAPDVGNYASLACCPGPFTREMSPDSVEIGIARHIQGGTGNFRRIIMVATFYPESRNWIKTGLCKSDRQRYELRPIFSTAQYMKALIRILYWALVLLTIRSLKEGMVDDSEYDDQDYEEEEARNIFDGTEAEFDEHEGVGEIKAIIIDRSYRN